jgi:hypothetical protein
MVPLEKFEAVKDDPELDRSELSTRASAEYGKRPT